MTSSLAHGMSQTRGPTPNSVRARAPMHFWRILIIGNSTRPRNWPRIARTRVYIRLRTMYVYIGNYTGYSIAVQNRWCFLNTTSSKRAVNSKARELIIGPIRRKHYAIKKRGAQLLDRAQ